MPIQFKIVLKMYNYIKSDIYKTLFSIIPTYVPSVSQEKSRVNNFQFVLLKISI